MDGGEGRKKKGRRELGGRTAKVEGKMEGRRTWVERKGRKDRKN